MITTEEQFFEATLDDLEKACQTAFGIRTDMTRYDLLGLCLYKARLTDPRPLPFASSFCYVWASRDVGVPRTRSAMSGMSHQKQSVSYVIIGPVTPLTSHALRVEQTGEHGDKQSWLLYTYFTGKEPTLSRALFNSQFKQVDALEVLAWSDTIFLFPR